MNIPLFFRWLLLSLSILALPACDLDFSGSSPAPASQNLDFQSPGPISLKVGDSFENPAIGQGEGDIAYLSSDDSVATVDAQGRVTILKLGHAQVIATIEADENYESASQVYEINTEFSVTAWIGENDTHLEFSDGTQGMEFYRSTDFSCDFTQYNSCENGAMGILDGSAVVDTTATLNQKALYQFSSADLIGKVEAPIERFSARRDHQTVMYKGKLWLIAGSDALSGAVRNDVWTSSDGVNWKEVTSNGGFEARREHQVVTFKDKLWLIGGWGESNELLNDVWSSSDGVNWVEETAGAPFSGRKGHQVVSFDGKLWLIGGNEIDQYTYDPFQHFVPGLNDVWSSSDGVSWVEELSSAPFSIRFSHQVSVFNDKMWLMGGQNHWSDHKDDVWSSEDGTTWTQALVVGEFEEKSDHQMAVYDGKLFIVGGRGRGTSTSIAYTSDGVNWGSEPISGDFLSPYRKGHQLTAFKEKLVLTGGWGLGNLLNNDVWFSTDGIQWVEQTTAKPHSRFRHQIKVFQDKLWMLGGVFDSAKNDIWSSTDGLSWKKEKAEAEFSERSKHAVALFDEKLWLIGGRDGAFDKQSDIWMSEDGVSWREVTPEGFALSYYTHGFIEFKDSLFVIGGNTGKTWFSSDGVSWNKSVFTGPAYQSRYIEYKGKLWSFGGEASGEKHNKIFSSVDGESWVEEASELKFSGRAQHQVVVFNDRLWLIGGIGNDSQYFNDIWSSIDGINWEQVVSSAPFKGVIDHQAVVFKGVIYIVGGFDSDRLNNNHVWSSLDGINWRKGVVANIGLSNSN